MIAERTDLRMDELLTHVTEIRNSLVIQRSHAHSQGCSGFFNLSQAGAKWTEDIVHLSFDRPLSQMEQSRSRIEGIDADSLIAVIPAGQS
jgi:hypothetical protein